MFQRPYVPSLHCSIVGTVQRTNVGTYIQPNAGIYVELAIDSCLLPYN